MPVSLPHSHTQHLSRNSGELHPPTHPDAKAETIIKPAERAERDRILAGTMTISSEFPGKRHSPCHGASYWCMARIGKRSRKVRESRESRAVRAARERTGNLLPTGALLRDPPLVPDQAKPASKVAGISETPRCFWGCNANQKQPGDLSGETLYTTNARAGEAEDHRAARSADRWQGAEGTWQAGVRWAARQVRDCRAGSR